MQTWTRGLSRRRATERPYFSHSVLTLASKIGGESSRWAIDDRIILDPMTGTGGFAIEAAQWEEILSL